MGGKYQGVDLLRGFKLTRDPQLKTPVAKLNCATRSILVFTLYLFLECSYGKTVIGKFLRKDLHPDFTLKATSDIDLQYPGDPLDLIFKIIGDILEARQSTGAGNGKDGDGHLGEVHLKDRGVFFQVTRQFPKGLINLVLHILQCLIYVGAGDKFDIDGGEPLGTHGLDLFQAIQPF